MVDIDERLKNAIVNSDINFLSKKNYDINHRFKDEDNETLLMYAISDDKTDIYKFFLKNNANIELVNDEGENVLHSIVYSGDTSRLIYFLDNYKFDINRKSLEGVSPLLLSTFLGKLKMFDLLLYYNANVSIADNFGNTPLHIACSLGYMQMVKKLIELGSNINLKNQNGNLPLALAINNGHHDIVKFLFAKIYTSSTSTNMQ